MKISQLKYKSRSVFYCPKSKNAFDYRRNKSDLYFPSQLEFSVFKVLEHWLGSENILLQVPILIKPKTNIYPAVYWRCDFRILDPNSPGKQRYMNIEAKGITTREFNQNMRFLEWQKPEEFKKLLLVHKEDNDSFQNRIKAISLKNLPVYLRSKGYVQRPSLVSNLKSEVKV